MRINPLFYLLLTEWVLEPKLLNFKFSETDVAFIRTCSWLEKQLHEVYFKQYVKDWQLYWFRNGERFNVGWFFHTRFGWVCSNWRKRFWFFLILEGWRHFIWLRIPWWFQFQWTVHRWGWNHQVLYCKVVFRIWWFCLAKISCQKMDD